MGPAIERARRAPAGQHLVELVARQPLLGALAHAGSEVDDDLGDVLLQIAVSAARVADGELLAADAGERSADGQQVGDTGLIDRIETRPRARCR